MHLQATVDYDHFARALSIGPETMVMDFRPDAADAQPVRRQPRLPLASRPASRRWRSRRIVNAFFGWEFNSCEMLVAGDDVYPIDYANACPDVAVTSLHYYFPWAITALVRWSIYCARRPAARTRSTCTPRATSRSPTTSRCPTTRSSTAYLALADEHFETDALLGVVRRAPAPPRRAGPRLGHRRRLRPAAARDRRRDVPRRTSRSSSWPTSAGSSTSGRPTTSHPLVEEVALATVTKPRPAMGAARPTASRPLVEEVALATVTKPRERSGVSTRARPARPARPAMGLGGRGVDAGSPGSTSAGQRVNQPRS